MTVTGPVVPRRYVLGNSASPTPPVDSFELGEIITCSKTGRMWVNGSVGGTITPIGVAFENSFTNLLGETLTGVKMYLEGSFPFQSAGTEAYGPWKFDGYVQMESSVVVSGPIQAETASFNGSTFSVQTDKTVSNDVVVSGNEVRIGTPDIAGTVSASRFHLLVNSSGFSFLDFSTSSSGTARTQVDASGLTSAGVKITSLPSVSCLATDASGNIVAAAFTPAPANASYICTASNPGLSNERVLAAGNHIDITDASGNVSVAWRYNPSLRSTIESECNASGNLTVQLSGTGAAVTYGGLGSGAYQSLATFTTGTTSAGRSSLGSSSVTSVIFGSGSVRFTAFVKLSQLSVSGQSHVFRAGFYDQLDGGVMGDAAYFEYTDSVNSGKFTCNVTAGGAAFSFVDSGVTVAANTWYKLEVNVNDTASRAEFFINGNSVHLATSSIPSGSTQSTGFGVTMRKTAGTTAHTAQADYVGCTVEVAR